MNRLHPQSMYASVREYLQELEESGVDGLPFEELQQTVNRGRELSSSARNSRCLPSSRALKGCAGRLVTASVAILPNPVPIWCLGQALKRPGWCLWERLPELTRTGRDNRLWERPARS
jgi:hypothetical protein